MIPRVTFGPGRTGHAEDGWREGRPTTRTEGETATDIGGWGRAVFAVTMIGVGALGLARGAGSRLWLSVPGWAPAHQALLHLSVIVPLACGIGLLWRRSSTAAASVLLGFLGAWLVLLDAPRLVLHPGMPFTYGVAETAALVAGAWVVYIQTAGRGDGRRVDAGAVVSAGASDGPRRSFGTSPAGLRIARTLYGLPLIPFGVAHFTYLARTVSMVPGWLPWHLAWAYFFGCTFIAAGSAVVLDVYARLAVALSAVQMGLFTVLVWVPVMVGAPSSSDWTEFVVSWALTAAAWAVADSYRGAPWLAARPARRRTRQGSPCRRPSRDDTRPCGPT